MANLLYGFLGWVAGALVNYLADVLPYRRKIVRPFCVQCGHEIGVINYFLFPRRCPSCGHKRSAMGWFIEAGFIVISLWLFHTPDVIFGYWGSMLLFTYFGVIVVIDIRHRLILHPVSLVGVALGSFLGASRHGVAMTLVGGIAGFLIMLGLYYLGELFAKSIAKRRGLDSDEVALGFGDVNLAGVIGLILGWPGVIGGLLLAILFGGFVSLFAMLVLIASRKYRMFTALPYGPFLVAAVIVLLYFKDLFPI